MFNKFCVDFSIYSTRESPEEWGENSCYIFILFSVWPIINLQGSPFQRMASTSTLRSWRVVSVVRVTYREYKPSREVVPSGRNVVVSGTFVGNGGGSGWGWKTCTIGGRRNHVGGGVVCRVNGGWGGVEVHIGKVTSDGKGGREQSPRVSWVGGLGEPFGRDGNPRSYEDLSRVRVTVWSHPSFEGDFRDCVKESLYNNRN